MEFSNKLTQLRKQKGFSQEAIAEKIGVSRQAISKWENEESYPDLPKLIALSEVLECSIDELCGHTTESKKEVSINTQKKKTSHYFIIFLLIGSFLLGNIFSNVGSAELPENVEISGLYFYSNGTSLDITFMSDVSNDKFKYEVVFMSNQQETVKIPLVCMSGSCKGTAQLVMGYPYNASFIISKGKEEKVIPLAERIKFSKDGSSWSAFH